MKTPIILTSCGFLLMVSCETTNGPGSGADFDPLQTPGARLPQQSHGGPGAIRPGQFVVATIDNTAFYNQRPGAEAEADQLLNRGTSMKVISTSGSFFRVELDSGEVGFVPRVMVQDPSAMADDDAGAEFEIYPAGFEEDPTTPLPDEPTDDSISPVDDTIPPVIEPTPAIEPEPEPEHVPLPDI